MLAHQYTELPALNIVQKMSHFIFAEFLILTVDPGARDAITTDVRRAGPRAVWPSSTKLHYK